MADRDKAEEEAHSAIQQIADLCKALAHPLRIEILDALDADPRRTLSASRFANTKDADLSRVSYHAIRLKQAGVLEVATERKVRGATERSYSLTGPRARLALDVIAMVRAGSAPS